MNDLIFRTVSNQDGPFIKANGEALPDGTEVSFTLVDTKKKVETAVVDVISGVTVGSTPVVKELVKGVFSADLWPNSRGDKSTVYLVVVEGTGISYYIYVTESQVAKESVLYFTEAKANAERVMFGELIKQFNADYDYEAVYKGAKKLDERYGELNYLNKFLLVAETTTELHRIASTCQLERNKVLFVCQNTVPNISTDVQNSRLVSMELTLDEGTKNVSATALTPIVDYRSLISSSDSRQTAFAAGPVLCHSKTGMAAGRTYLFFTTNKEQADPVNLAAKVYITFNDWNGSGWSNPVCATSLHAALTETEELVTSSGPNGIQLQSGRLLVPLYIYGGSGDRAVFAYSDDGGMNWALGNRVNLCTNETCVAEDINGVVWALSRRSIPAGTPGGTFRALEKSVDGGITWEVVDSTAYLDSVCNASIIQAVSFGGLPKFIHANVTEQSGFRGQLKVRFSYGEPGSYDKEIPIETKENRAGYTSLCMFNEQDILLVYESKENFYSGNGIVESGVISQSLSACVFNAKLEKNSKPSLGHSVFIQESLPGEAGYRKYRARVLADGGVIVNSSLTRSFFDWFAAMELPNTQAVYGANFGVKFSAEQVVKLYSFDGNDMIPEGVKNADGPFFDSAKPAIFTSGLSGGAKYFVSRHCKAVLPEDETVNNFCIYFSGKTKSADNSRHTFEAVSDETGNFGQLAIHLYNSDEGASIAEAAVAKSTYSELDISAAQVLSVSAGAYGDYKGVVAFVDTVNGKVSTYSEGALINDDVSAGAGGVYDFRSTPLRLMLGSLKQQGVIVNLLNNFTAECGIIAGCTKSQAQQLSTRLAGLY